MCMIDCMGKYRDALARIGKHPSYRHKVLTSIAVYGIFSVMGGFKGQLGPAFLDLRKISDVELEEGSFIVTSLYVGYALGALANGFLYHRCNGNLLFGIGSLFLGVVIAVIPWCSWYGLMVTCHVVTGLLVGLMDAAGNAEIIRLWNTRSQTILVGLHVIYNFGGVISPIIIAPFLTKYNSSTDVSTSPQPLADQLSIHQIVSSSPSEYNQQNISNKFSDSDNESSKIYIAYSISSVICVLHCFLFLYLYRGQDKNISVETSDVRVQQSLSKEKEERQIVNLNTNGREPFVDNGYQGGKQENLETYYQNQNIKDTEMNLLSNIDKSVVSSTYERNLPREIQVIAGSIMVSFGVMCCAIDFGFSTYLSPFCVEYLNWTKTEGSLITSLLFVLVVCGGVSSVFLIKCINSKVYIGVQSVLICSSFVVFFLSSNFGSNIGIWFSVPLYGFAKSAVFPLVIAWTNRTFMQVSGRVSSIFFVGAMGGSAANLYFLAFIMEEVGKIWFCYILIIEGVLLVVIYTCAVTLSKYVKRVYKENPKSFEHNNKSDV